MDRAKKKDRIREWIQASTIVEEYEEDESDLNEDVARVYEDEDEEPSSMKGRHFPETRPVVNTEAKRHRNRTHTSSARKRQPIKRQPTERKIPFAPQVAVERETVARFASFPNGDPNLAARTNGTNGDAAPPLALPLKTGSTVEHRRSLANGQANNSPATGSFNYSPSRDESLAAAGYNKSPNPAERRTVELARTSQDIQDRTTVGENRGLPRSPQIPARKHRSQTAPFPASNSNENEGESARRTQSAGALAGSTQPDRSNMAIGRPVERSGAPVANGQSSMAWGESSTPRAEHRSLTQSMSRVENAPVVMLPVAAATVRVENQSVTRNEKPGPVALASQSANPLTMSVASHLVMQSFNALQGINAVVAAGDNSSNSATDLANSPRNNSPSSTPSKALTPKNSPTTTPARTSTPPKNKLHREETMIYRKDPFEHYGIAQGVILRTEGVRRRDSTESGNRSASN